MLEYHRITEAEKYIISEWKYDEPYSIYNNIPYIEQLQKHQGFANVLNNYYSYYDREKLVGYINLKENGAEVLLGIGVHPQLCGQGYGKEILKMACILSHKLYSNKKVALEVRSWNLRAIRCYQKAGFVINGKAMVKMTPLGREEFYRMEERCDGSTKE